MGFHAIDACPSEASGDRRRAPCRPARRRPRLVGRLHPAPKTHTPFSRVKERGLRFYSPELGRWLNRDPIEEKGGIALYLFVENSPVVGCDAVGLVWTYRRARLPRARVECNCGDTLAALQPLIDLDVREAYKWLKVEDGGDPIPRDVNLPFTETRILSAPNTVYVYRGYTGSIPPGARSFNWYSLLWLDSWMDARTTTWDSDGFRVVRDEHPFERDVGTMLRSDTTYGFAFFGHGPDMAVNANSGTGHAWILWRSHGQLVSYGLGIVQLFGCSTYVNPLFRIVSQTGWFYGNTTDVTARDIGASMRARPGTHSP